jgi:hypothetical protein
MKKTILFALMAFSFCFATAQTAAPHPAPSVPEKSFTVTLKSSDWDKVIYVINKSGASYPEVTEVQTLVFTPLFNQARDTTQNAAPAPTPAKPKK